MQGALLVRGNGRYAPVLTDGYENQTHRGGRPPKGRVMAKLLETPSRVVTTPTKNGVHTRINIIKPSIA